PMSAKEPWSILGQQWDPAHRSARMCIYPAAWALVAFLSQCRLDQPLLKTIALSALVPKWWKAVSYAKVRYSEWVSISANQPKLLIAPRVKSTTVTFPPIQSWSLAPCPASLFPMVKRVQAFTAL